jgi:hypothetical protein
MKRSGLNRVRTAGSSIRGILARFPDNRRPLIIAIRIAIAAAAGLAVLCLRFHSIEEGRALGRRTAYAQGLARGKQLAVCPKTNPPRGGAIGRAQHQR